MTVPASSEAPARHPQRVLVAGASGAGKTTLARLIAERWHLPHTELDGLHWHSGWIPNPDFASDVHRLAEGEHWVTEFQYGDARPILAARAELLVYLAFPRALVMSRVIRRTVRRRRSAERLWDTDNREPPLRTILTDNDHIIRWAWKSIDRYAEVVAETRQSHPALQIVTLRSPRKAARWLERGWQDSDDA